MQLKLRVRWELEIVTDRQDILDMEIMNDAEIDELEHAPEVVVEVAVEIDAVENDQLEAEAGKGLTRVEVDQKCQDHHQKIEV